MDKIIIIFLFLTYSCKSKEQVIKQKIEKEKIEKFQKRFDEVAGKKTYYGKLSISYGDSAIMEYDKGNYGKYTKYTELYYKYVDSFYTYTEEYLTNLEEYLNNQYK